MSMEFHGLQVRSIVPEGDDAVVLDLAIPPEFRSQYEFEPGQHLTLRRLFDGQDVRRSYSICSAERRGLQIGVRKVPGGLFSSWIHDNLAAGASVDVMPPQGRFGKASLQADARHVLGVAGGSGITPILAIMSAFLEADPSHHFTLLYGNRTQRSTMFKEQLEDLKNRFLDRLAIHLLFSREHTDSPLNSGRMTEEKVAEFLSLLVDVRSIDEAFVCGPHEVNDAVERALLRAGMSADHIHVERFGVPDEVRNAAAPAAGIEREVPQATVTLVRDGIRRSFDYRAEDGSVLEAAARAGLEVPFSCRSGVCCTCRAKLLEGQVRMARNFSLERKELDQGFILTCQSHPLSAAITISFDER